MHLSVLEKTLLVAGFISTLVLLCVLFYRRRARRYLLFTAFNVFEISKTIFLTPVLLLSTRSQYAAVYWPSLVIDYAFQMVLLIAIAVDILRTERGWVPGTRRFFACLSLCASALATAVSLSLRFPNTHGWNLFDARANVFTSLMITQLFIAISASANRLHLRRNRYALALGLGFTTWAFTSLLEVFFFTLKGWSYPNFFTLLREGTYCAVILYWAAAFWPDEAIEVCPSSTAAAVLHEQVREDLARLSGGFRR